MGCKVAEGIDATYQECKQREYWLKTVTGWAFDRLSPPQYEEFAGIIQALCQDADWPFDFCPSCDCLVEVDVRVNAQGIAAVCVHCGSHVD